MQFLTDYFGPLEWLLFVEFAVLATATVFYQIAKWTAGRNYRSDPLVRFYYVFWQAFNAPVTPVGVLRAREAERIARAKGFVMAGDVTPEMLNREEAPDLGEMTRDDLQGRPIETPPAMLPPEKSVRRGEEVSTVKDATLEVRITGRCKQNRVSGHDGRVMLAEVTFEVEDGQANGVVVELASAALDVPVYRIVLLGGHYKMNKSFKIVGMGQAELESRVRQL